MPRSLSQTEAVALFQKWKASKNRLLVGFHAPSAFNGQFDGFVSVAESEIIVVSSDAGSHINLQIPTSECRFVLPDVQGDEDAFLDAEHPLAIQFPVGATCTVIAFAKPN